MQPKSELEKEVTELIIESLNLEEVSADDIEPDQALFGEGLALDSIDALELALAVTQKYAIQIKADDAKVKEVFASVRNLSAFIANKQA